MSIMRGFLTNLLLLSPARAEGGNRMHRTVPLTGWQ
jgi:hypothetical protein